MHAVSVQQSTAPLHETVWPAERRGRVLFHAVQTSPATQSQSQEGRDDDDNSSGSEGATKPKELKWRRGIIGTYNYVFGGHEITI